MKENKLRSLLADDKPTVGTHILNTWPATVELLGLAGEYDYVEFSYLYAPWDWYAIDNMVRAAELVDLSSMIKIDQNPRIYLAQRALESGVQSVLFSDIRTVKDVEEAVSAVKPAPKGIAGLRMGRRLGYVLPEGKKPNETLSEYVDSLADAVIVMMIENKESVENLEEILSVKGVDMVQWGPGDYSISAGIPGQFDDPHLREIELEIIETALKMDIRPRIECEIEEVQKYVELGVRDFCIGTDTDILYKKWCNDGKKIRKVLKKNM